MKKLMIIAIILLAALNVGQLLYNTFSDRLVIVAIPSDETAVEVGKAVLLARYGEAVLSQEPFTVRYNRFFGYWVVSGTRSDDFSDERGIFSVSIHKNDGRVMRMRGF